MDKDKKRKILEEARERVEYTIFNNNEEIRLLKDDIRPLELKLQKINERYELSSFDMD